MADAIFNTSPLVYLHRSGALDWLPRLLGAIWTPNAVGGELSEGRRRGYDVPDPADLAWLHLVDPRVIPSEWLSPELHRRTV